VVNAAVVKSVVVTRHRHPFEGHSLVVLGQMKRHGAVELLVVLPDGSKTLMPACWTDQEDGVATGDAGMPGMSDTATLASIGDLLAASALVSDLQIRAGNSCGQQAAQQPPRKEDDRAACPTESDARGRVGANPGGRRVAAPEPARHRDRDAGPIDGRRGRRNNPRRQS
jgi:hypothetical protein